MFIVSPAHAELTNGMDADVVVGQPDFSSNTQNLGGVSMKSIGRPRSLVVNGNRLFISEANNGGNRILIWNQIPTSHYEAADVVVGQPDFETNTNNAGGLSARSVFAPTGVGTDGQRMFIGDQLNHRVLIFNSIPQSNFAAADIVLGQPDFGQNAINNGGLSASSLQQPIGVAADGTRLFVVDTRNHRVLIWNQFPTRNFQAADVVLGQPNFTSNTANNGGLSDRTLSLPVTVTTNGEALLVSDQGNHRILIWKSIPNSNFAPADAVIGQPNFKSSASGLAANRLNNPRGVFFDGKRIFVAETANSRVLIWNGLPEFNGAPADFVLGQNDFFSSNANVSSRHFNSPREVFFDGSRLYVTDGNNHRLLIFNINQPNNKNLGPQFDQGKAVVGKVFWDVNGDGRQNPVKNEE